jgi:hypothetical protein
MPQPVGTGPSGLGQCHILWCRFRRYDFEGWGSVMILGFSTFTWVHVLISLIGIVSGLVVLKGLLASDQMNGWTAVFVVTTALTSITGFGFPFDRLLPSHMVGIVSLAVLLVTILARYAFHMRGAWRGIYVVTAITALWLNVFVLVAQFFSKVPALHAIAPTQSEPPFLVAETVVLIVFVGLAIGAVRKFHPQAI